jgi:hypothetical protein
MVPSTCDVIEAIFTHLDLPSLSQARSVCRQWHSIGGGNSVIAAATSNSKSIKITRTDIVRNFGLTHTQANSLPGAVPYITRRGYTCWLYGPEVISLLISGGYRERREKQKRWVGGQRPRAVAKAIECVVASH